MDKFYKERPDLHHKCPVKGCEGLYTTTKNPRILNHILIIAKSELFKRELIDKEISTPHLDYIKANYKVAFKEEKIIRLKPNN